MAEIPLPCGISLIFKRVKKCGRISLIRAGVKQKNILTCFQKMLLWVAETNRKEKLMATHKKKMVSFCQNGDGTPFHYFASSIVTWKVDTDLQKLINYMQSEGFSFNIFKVDLDIKAPYGITCYTPDLPKETSRFIAHFTSEE